MWAALRGEKRGKCGGVAMTNSGLVLRRPRVAEEDEFLSAHRATSPGCPFFLHYYSEGMPFSRYLEILSEIEEGRGVEEDHAPSTFLFAFSGLRIVGRTSIRHRLTPTLERVGGHIGYVVVPEFRRRGFATEILQMSLRIARDRLGIRKARLTCDADNWASIRTIEKNGGVLEDVIAGEDLPTPKRRYLIDCSSL